MQPQITPEYLASQGLSASFPARFWPKVNKTESCWLWTGAKWAKRYGSINRGEGRGLIQSHRASWILHFGPIPEGKQVLHNCPNGDNPLCVNPHHLWLGTQKENVDDMVYKDRGSGVLSIEDVKTIRSLKDSGISQYALADQFGVSQGHISEIMAGKKHKPVAKPIYRNPLLDSRLLPRNAD